MFGLIFRGLGSLVSFAFPVFASYRALEQDDVTLIRPWLAYWVVIAIQLTVESYFGLLLSAVPLYSFFRLIFMLWLVLPQFQGASQIYSAYVAPFLREHEQDIDQFINKTHRNAKALGLEYLARATHFVREYATSLLFGTQMREYVPTQDSTQSMGHLSGVNAGDDHQDAAAGIGSSYADLLLSRFRAPGPMRSDAPGATGVTGGSHGAASAGVAAAGNATGASAMGATFGSLLSAASANVFHALQRSNDTSSTKADRLGYIHEQRSELQNMLTSLDTHARAIEEEPEEPAPNPTARSGLRSRVSNGSLSGENKSATPSELDFQVVGADEGSEERQPENSGSEQPPSAGKKGWLW